LAPVRPEEVGAVQDVIESDPGYVQRVTGLPPGPADAQSLLLMRPPDLPEERKLVLGIRRDGEIVGLVDVLRGFPEPDIAYLGLLQLRGDLQGQGLGRAAHDELLTLLGGWPEIRRRC
jgi:RimJ/RimL family protein N-acetyltransferase